MKLGEMWNLVKSSSNNLGASIKKHCQKMKLNNVNSKILFTEVKQVMSTSHLTCHFEMLCGRTSGNEEYVKNVTMIFQTVVLSAFTIDRNMQRVYWQMEIVKNVALILQTILMSTFTVNSKLISIWFASSLLIVTCVNTNL